MSAHIKKGFNTDQLVSSTDVVRNFSKMRSMAKTAPLLILDKNSPDSVLLSIEDYNYYIQLIEQLSGQLFDYKVANKIKEIEEKGYEAVPFSEIATPKIMKIAEEIEDWEITDEELFDE